MTHRPYRALLARVATASEAHRRHGGDPVPGLAVGLLASSEDRRVLVAYSDHSGAGPMRLAEATAVAFLRDAPVNISRLTVVTDRAAVRAVTAALREHACHSYARQLRIVLPGVPELQLTEGDVAALLAATGGLAHVRVLQLGGPHAVAAAQAARRRLRCVHLSYAEDVGALDMAPFPRVTRLQLVNLTRLETFTPPPRLRLVGSFGFRHCAALVRLDLSGTPLSRVDFSFAADCAALAEVLLPPTLAAMGDGAIESCIALARLDLSVTRLVALPDRFMLGCTRLTELLLPPSLVTVGVAPLYGCSAITALDLSATRLTLVASGFLAGCAALAALALPPTLRTVGAGAHPLVAGERLRAAGLCAAVDDAPQKATKAKRGCVIA
jgi:hypothetical protein